MGDKQEIKGIRGEHPIQNTKVTVFTIHNFITTDCIDWLTDIPAVRITDEKVFMMNPFIDCKFGIRM